MASFIMMCGLPGAGKSTYTNNLINKGFIVHSSDAIRAELGDVNDQSQNKKVFEILNRRVKEDLKNGKNVCVDACNISRRSRHDTLAATKDIQCKKECLVVQTPYRDCVENNKKRDRHVPVSVILNMALNFEMPTYEEGFDAIVFA